ncbi:hypothetical protein LOTGIDRAFT_129499 [Lottia gigantea]|uniref:Sodium/nucleoside cotransporter n=1 Tax=Lottia gigantea TaxID=225164 RepID=V3ZUM0_LOTGI|nr:hypothetical protein LOTGIDRAFT_129499 [Lottia gigantea]ESO86275.1 hypothetical protein LOTGIDRAFT_129499 [Lottia gigantea]
MKWLICTFQINWHCIFWCLSTQFILAITLLRTEWGVYIMDWIAGCVKAFMENGYKSSEFLFGKSSDHRIVMKSLPLLFLVNSFLAILYHFGLMQIVLKCIGKALSSTLETTPPESLSVAANLFLGGTQATLVIKPYLNTMSISELFALVVGCFSSVSGVVFGIYINFGAPAKHLLTASIMSAPASFAIAKLLVPETKPNRDSDWENTKLDITKYKNILDATGRGALEVMGVFTSIVVNLYVFYALLQFLNSVLIWSGERIGIENLSFQLVVSYLLMPLPVFMGVDIQDCRSIAKLIGYKLVGSNSLSFIKLGKLRENKELSFNFSPSFQERSTAIATYAMCGFSNFSSIGIMLGTLYVLIPKRNGILVKIICKAMIAGNIACYLTACIAGKAIVCR